VLNVKGAPRFLLSEALRGEGARLVNEGGEAFMSRYEAAGDLASRDLVSRAMVAEAQRTHSTVYLTMDHLDRTFVHERFPTISQACRQVGLDLWRDRIPVSPAAHYVMGGVETDLNARTSLPGLLAAGEVACTGVHGANRLASNSLLEGLVFGARAAAAMMYPPQAGVFAGTELWQAPAPVGTSESFPSANDVRDTMWRHAGLLRDRDSLQRAAEQLDRWSQSVMRPPRPRHSELEFRRVRSLVIAGLLIARAALRRRESRGGHFRTDFPAHDDVHWKKRIADILVGSSD
jgi:L-aspartate oxidase